MEFEDSINVASGILNYIFEILDTNDVHIKQIMPWLFYRKKVKTILPTSSKIHILFREKLKIIWKKQNDPDNFFFLY